MRSSLADHDVFRLQVAVHHAVLVHVVEGVADAQRNAGPRARWAACAALVQNRPQQPPLDPLDDHVEAAALFAVVGLHHAGVVQFLADLLLALEALDQDRVGLHLRQRNLDGHLPAVVQVGGPVEHRHAAVGNGGLDAVVVERFSGFKRRPERVLHGNSILSCES